MTVQDYSVSSNNAFQLLVNTPIVRAAVIGQFSAMPSGSQIGHVFSANQGNIANYGIGKGTETVKTLLNAGLQTIDCYPIQSGSTGALAALSGSFVNQGNMSGLSTGSVVPVISGVPLDDYLPRLEIVSGSNNTNTLFRYSLDGGSNFNQQLLSSGTTNLPLYAAGAGSSNAVGSGLSVNFPAGTYVSGDVFSTFAFPVSATVTSTTANDGTIADAFTQLAVQPVKYSHIYCACRPQGTSGQNAAADTANATALATLHSALITGANSLDTVNDVPCLVIGEELRKADLGDALNVVFQTTVTNALAPNKSLADSYRLLTAYGNTNRRSALQNGNVWRSASLALMERIAQYQDPSRSVYEDAGVPVQVPNTAIQFAPLSYTGILATGSDYDETMSVNTGGGTSGAVTPLGMNALYRSNHSAVPGSFIFLAGNTFSDPTNPNFEAAWVTQMNELRRVVDQAMFFYKGKELETIKSGGNAGALSEKQARRIETRVDRIVNDSLVKQGYIPAFPSTGVDINGTIFKHWANVSRTQNVVTSSTLVWTTVLAVNAYIKRFSAVDTLAL